MFKIDYLFSVGKIYVNHNPNQLAILARLRRIACMHACKLMRMTDPSEQLVLLVSMMDGVVTVSALSLFSFQNLRRKRPRWNYSIECTGTKSRR